MNLERFSPLQSIYSINRTDRDRCASLGDECRFVDVYRSSLSSLRIVDILGKFPTEITIHCDITLGIHWLRAGALEAKMLSKEFILK